MNDGSGRSQQIWSTECPGSGMHTPKNCRTDDSLSSSTDGTERQENTKQAAGHSPFCAEKRHQTTTGGKPIIIDFVTSRSSTAQSINQSVQINHFIIIDSLTEHTQTHSHTLSHTHTHDGSNLIDHDCRNLYDSRHSQAYSPFLFDSSLQGTTTTTTTTMRRPYRHANSGSDGSFSFVRRSADRFDIATAPRRPPGEPFH